MAGKRRYVQSPAARSPRRPQVEGPSFAAFFFWTFFLVGSAIVYLWIYNQADVVTAEIINRRQEIAVLENLNREHGAEINQLAHIDRIARIAKNDLNMFSPDAESLIVYLPEVPH